MWDYAVLSTEASKAGGPAALRKALRLAGRHQGLQAGMRKGLQVGAKKGLEVGLKVGRGQGLIIGSGLVGGAWLCSALNARGVFRNDPEPAGSSATEAPTAPQEAPAPPTEALTAPSAPDGNTEGDPQPDPVR
ncbi:Yae1 family protein [Streptomyces parvus]|uniref:Yae1 family protein n=1 Tax=Streptomyces parvus TaxID=66428 RepID=UPI0033BFDE32